MKLGHVQQGCLEGLKTHGQWQRGLCGWMWDTPSRTEKVMVALVSNGLAKEEDGVYRITDAGRKALNARETQTTERRIHISDRTWGRVVQAARGRSFSLSLYVEAALNYAVETNFTP